jgi:two-component system sensor histidine kinase YesM
MGEVETGRRNRFPSEHYGDEIGTLGNAFNRMIDRLDEMMKKNAEAERKKREAEYRALEFQINPHFLYNTLSSIVWLTSKDKKEESMHMTKDLSTLFRISISKGKDIISVKDEIDHVRCYLNIQGIRYSDEFDVSYDVDPAILEYRSLKLVLQPLTENAIYHGIKNLDRKGHISIRGYAADEGLIFEVIDDGGAMDEALAENINDFLISGKNEQSFGIGIRNVHDRIRFYFGEGYGLSFQIRGGMTVARVVMPIIEEDPPVVYYPGR